MCITLTFHLSFIFSYNLLVFAEFRRRRHDALKTEEPNTESSPCDTNNNNNNKIKGKKPLFPPPVCCYDISNRLLWVEERERRWLLFHIEARAPRIMISCSRRALRKPAEEQSTMSFPLPTWSTQDDAWGSRSACSSCEGLIRARARFSKQTAGLGPGKVQGWVQIALCSQHNTATWNKPQGETSAQAINSMERCEHCLRALLIHHALLYSCYRHKVE